MLPSKCFFFKINCPFFDDNHCDRPHCHFKHSKKVKNNVRKKYDSNKNQENDNLLITHLVRETVKHVINRIDPKDENEENPDISAVVEDIVSDIQNSTNNAKFLALFSKSKIIPEYKPTPIEKLNRHIPVQVAPTRPSYQMSSRRNKNTASFHATKHKDTHRVEHKHNLWNDLHNTISALPIIESVSSSREDNVARNCDESSIAEQMTHSYSSYTKQILQFESENSSLNCMEFGDESVPSFNKHSQTAGIRKPNELSNELSDYKEEKIKINVVPHIPKKNEKSLRESGSLGKQDQTENLKKKSKKLSKTLDNILGSRTKKRPLEESEEVINLEDELLDYEEEENNSATKNIREDTTAEISPPKNEQIQKNENHKGRRISLVGGGLPCNSLISGPFVDLLERWHKAKEKIQKSTSQDNKKIAVVHNVESILFEKNKLLSKSTTSSLHDLDDNNSNELAQPSVKHRIAHQNIADTTLSTKLDYKRRKTRRSL
ncbi:uncharacterized protein [Rhodnius prolixus]|uniref:uncharacterized protein n=1 Tax=Rhodnius prolixus TaxID=13249 RepID=UPI003D18F5EB